MADHSSYRKKPLTEWQKKNNQKIFNQFRKEDDKKNGFPSKEMKRDWVFTQLDHDFIHKYKPLVPDEDKGKWLIFVEESDIDRIWGQVRKLYRTGEIMGQGTAKCSTHESKSLNPDGLYVIIVYCVCTEDRMFNRIALREKAGITWDIFYKSEKDTGVKYSWNGDRNISKYYE